jgi:hypothetical protein
MKDAKIKTGNYPDLESPMTFKYLHVLDEILTEYMSTTDGNTESHRQKLTCKKDGNWQVKKSTVQVLNNIYGVFINTAPHILLTEK